MAKSYTDAQIAEVCAKAKKAVADFTTVQNGSFSSTHIIAGMKAGKTADEICNDIWESYKGLSQYPDQYGLVGRGAVNGNNMLNVQQIISGAIHQAIAEIDAGATPTPTPEPVVEYEYTKVTPEGTENPKTEGWYEADGQDGYKETTDETVDKEKEYYTRTEKT